MMKRTIIGGCLFFLVVFLANCKSNTTNKKTTEPIFSVFTLMENPVYEKTIKVDGTISELHIRNSLSFKLSSGGKSINAWYGMMVKDNRKSQPSVKIKGLKNGMRVILTGTLKNKGKYVQKDHFWIHSIRRK